MFGWLSKGKAAEEAIKSFEKEIARQEDILFGVSLFFDCISILHAGQTDVLETHKKEFRNIIQDGTETIRRAKELLQEARSDHRKIEQVNAFMFTPCAGYPHPDQLLSRAETLVATYERIFTGRPRSQELTKEEALRLLEEAAGTFYGS